MAQLIGLLNMVLGFLMFAIFIRAILSWLPLGSSHPVVVFIFRVTEPMLQPIRRFMPRMGVMDLSPMVAIILLIILRAILGRVI